jgi:hypothetical protein
MKEFWRGALVKLVENILSIKVAVIFSYMILSFILLWYNKLTSTDFATSNGAIISVVFALREGFKVAKIKRITNEKEKEKMMV